MAWKWTCWMFLHLMVSGTRSEVIVHQPPLLTVALGHDVIMPCHFNLSSNEKLSAKPVLYWYYGDTGNVQVWHPSEKYAGRVALLDQHSPNKSILLKNVQWADGGKYECKVSFTQERQRFRRGNETLLMVYDTIVFDLNNHNNALCCEVNVTWAPGLGLSIFHNGYKVQTVGSAAREHVARLPYVTLSETISLTVEGQFECQLHLNKDLITKSTFDYPPSVIGNYEEPEKNISAICGSCVEVCQEPWLLYGALLLVPITILLVLLIIMLTRRVCASSTLLQHCSR